MLAPFQVDFDVTLECMYKCKHCNVDAGEKLIDEMTTEQIFSVIDQLDAIGVSDISITGGEPLLRKDCLEILAYAHSKAGVNVTLNTNGLLLSKEVIEKLEVDCPRLNIAVSLDGFSPETYSVLRKDINDFDKVLYKEFEQVSKVLQMLHESKLSVGVNFTATKQTIDNVWKTYEFIKNIGIEDILLIKFFPFGQGSIFKEELELDYSSWRDFLHEATLKKKNEKYYNGVQISTTCPWEIYLPLLESYKLEEIHSIWNYNSPLESELYRKYRNVGCHAGVTSCAISPNGDLYPCGTISSKYPSFVCGNLKSEKLEDIWNNSCTLEKFRAVDIKEIKGECQECDLKLLCGGGCRARAHTHSGDLLGQDYLCPINQKQIQPDCFNGFK